MDVNEAGARYTASYDGRMYYFCSAGCKEEFERNPGKFAAAQDTTSYGNAVRSTAENVKQKAQEKTEEVRSKVQQQAKEMAFRRKGQASEGLTVVAQALRDTAHQLQEKDQAAIARYADNAAQSLDRFSHYLSEKDMDQLMADAENLVKRRPALFMGGALAAGFLIARFFKSAPSAVGSARSGRRPFPAESEGEAAG
jgi:YHS domain-containing protein